MSILEANDLSFKEEVIKSVKPVLVDFWAPWCGPCRMIASTIDEIANDYKHVLKVVQVNTDKNPSIATEYEVRSIPTIMIFINGERVDTVIGAVPKLTLLNTLKKHLEN
uniref:Thioredoxin n=1 Tax=Anotrichium furcellatum TaxID=41999 RepID=A0A4D6WNE9_9FLOR|nr:Thioredoxin [Anotrichium furcellatum]